MKFNCGLTPQEKFQKKREEILETIEELSLWQDTFAWLPVQVASGDCRWLETYQVRGIFIGLGLEYETLADRLTNSMVEWGSWKHDHNWVWQTRAKD